MEKFTVKDISELLGVSKPTVQRSIKALGITPIAIVKNKYRIYDREAAKAVILHINPDFELETKFFDTPPQIETNRQNIETNRNTTEIYRQNTETNQNAPKQQTESSELETIKTMLAMLQQELENKNLELQKKDEKIQSLEDKLHDTYKQIAVFAEKAQYITAADKTVQLMDKGNKENTVITVENNENKKPGFFRRLFKK